MFERVVLTPTLATGLLGAFVVAVLPAVARAKPSPDRASARESPSEWRIEQRVAGPTDKILEQVKGTVCGTGPIYVGAVDAPVFVRPLLKVRCTLTTPEQPR